MATLIAKELANLPSSYFQAVDRGDIEGVLTHFDERATFTILTHNVTFTGTDELRGMFTRLIDSVNNMLHAIKSTFTNQDAQRIVTEQQYTAEYKDGTRQEMSTVNFYDVGGDGRFTKVVVYMAGSNPLN